MDRLIDRYRPMLHAVSFAARAHDGQLRKDERTPYVSHVFRVCLIVRHIFGVDDPDVLMAALLHDTIEDTTTDFDDLVELLGKSGESVPAWVASLSKDKRRPEDVREAEYLKVLTSAPWQVRLCKFADLFDNMLDSHSFSDRQFQKTLQRSRTVFAALRAVPPDSGESGAILQRASDLVEKLMDEIERERQK